MNTYIIIAAMILVYLYQVGSMPVQAESTLSQRFDGVIVSDDTRTRFAIDLANRLGNNNPSADTIAFIVAWQAGENTLAANNPLATTQPAYGDNCFNYLSGRCGVRNYPDYATGLNATVETLTNGYYPNTLYGIMTNTPVIDDVEMGIWGTGAGNIRAHYYNED